MLDSRFTQGLQWLQMKKKINRQRLAEYMANHPEMAKGAVAKVFHISRQSIYDILKEVKTEGNK